MIRPAKTITRGTSAEEINWLKDKLNKCLGTTLFTPLELNGVYDNKTRIALLIAWELWGWNKEGKDDGWRAGLKTIDKLDSI